MIGPNGAGKSTLFKLITSFLGRSSGRVSVRGEEISGAAGRTSSRARAWCGPSRRPRSFKRDDGARERRRGAPSAHPGEQSSASSSTSPTARADEASFRDSAAEILDYLGPRPRQARAGAQPSARLSARARHRASPWRPSPRSCCSTSRSPGMNPEETDRAVRMVQGIRDRGVTVLLVEHDMSAVMRISDRIVVLNFGTKIAEGTPAEIQRGRGGDRGLSRARGRDLGALSGDLQYFEACRTSRCATTRCSALARRVDPARAGPDRRR